MSQEVKYIPIKDLVLWTENPRDKVDPNATDQEIADRALHDNGSKWTLAKLASEMGEEYDFSELPTVVYKKDKPVVYDGNRRIILGKIKHGFVTVEDKKVSSIPSFPENIPCNVCDEKTALRNVLRKHAESGSWQPLERDIFLHKFMRKPKSPFLVLEQETGIISQNPHLNQRFVKEEIFKEDGLKALGFEVIEGKLLSVHDEKDARAILADISEKIKEKKISTREHRGKVVEVLAPSSQRLIEQNKNRELKHTTVNFTVQQPVGTKRQTRRTRTNKTQLFGGKLYLQMGDVSNLYRDIVDLHEFYNSNKATLSHSFPGLIRMALRLLAETAAAGRNSNALTKYIQGNFAKAKATLDQDIKTLLSNHNVKEETMAQLLHTGAHNYLSTGNMEQTIAISIALGAMLTITHGKED